MGDGANVYVGILLNFFCIYKLWRVFTRNGKMVTGMGGRITNGSLYTEAAMALPSSLMGTGGMYRSGFPAAQCTMYCITAEW